MADAKKTAFVRDLARRMQELDTLFDDAVDIEKEYFDLGYNSGANVITDAVVAMYNLTAANFASAITLIQQLKNFATGQAVSAADYAATTNVFKRAPV